MLPAISAPLALAAAASFPPPPPPPPPTGACNFTGWLNKRTASAVPGVQLVTPMHELRTYLVDLDGQVVHHWMDEHIIGVKGYLEPDGTYVRIVCSSGSCGGGGGDGVRRLAWDGSVKWDYKMQCAHHDAVTLPNGNIAILCADAKSADEVAAAGGTGGALKAASIHEVKQDGATGGQVVWQWGVWDHLVQSTDAQKPNYAANVSTRPGRLDVNRGSGGDWNHVNAIDYNAELDQIMVSFPAQNEIYIIDHSTTTSEAAGSTGGRSGRGGDFLWRWGNPANYGHPSAGQQLYFQHNAHWVTTDVPSADPNAVLIFNNRNYTGAEQSTVPELSLPPPDGKTGTYAAGAGGSYGPATPSWVWSQAGFYSGHISGSQRLAGGNTVITNGETGVIVEVDAGGDVAWQFTYGCTGPDAWDCQFRSYRYPLSFAGFAGRELSKPVECNAPGPAPGPGPAPPPAGDCQQQVQADGCLAAGSQSDCFHCIHKHQQDLLAAGCSTHDVRAQCPSALA